MALLARFRFRRRRGRCYQLANVYAPRPLPNGPFCAFQTQVPRYPFAVSAVRTTHLVSLGRSDMEEVLINAGTADRDAFKRVVQQASGVREGPATGRVATAHGRLRSRAATSTRHACATSR